jgi:transposase-like protein
VAQAVVVATGVCGDGRREVLGFAVGDSEDGAFWTAFLRSLKARGLGEVQLVIADAHLGLRQAVQATMAGAAVQRCRVHFLRNVLARVPKGSSEMVAAAIRTIFAQPDAAHVHDQLDVIAGMLGRQFPKLEAMLRDNADDLLAFASFPPSHWKKVWSTNPLERLNKEINAAPTWSESSPTPTPYCGWPGPCSSRPMTSGRSATAATSPKAPWPALLTTTTKEVTPAQLMPA